MVINVSKYLPVCWVLKFSGHSRFLNVLNLNRIIKIMWIFLTKVYTYLCEIDRLEIKFRWNKTEKKKPNEPVSAIQCFKWENYTYLPSHFSNFSFAFVHAGPVRIRHLLLNDFAGCAGILTTFSFTAKLMEVCAYQTGWDDGDSIICDSTQEKYEGDAQLSIKALTRKRGFITKIYRYIILLSLSMCPTAGWRSTPILSIHRHYEKW